jgi:hypothetical protein
MTKRNLWILAALAVLMVVAAVGFLVYSNFAKASNGLVAQPAKPQSTILYLCYLNDKSRTKVLTRDLCKWSAQDIVHVATDYAYALPGDIQGKTYHFNIWFEAVKSTANFTFQIVLRQKGTETILASNSVEATKNGYQQFSVQAEGIDPTTSKGDILIFRIVPPGAQDGAVLYTSDEAKTSYIEIAPIQ